MEPRLDNKYGHWGFYGRNNLPRLSDQDRFKGFYALQRCPDYVEGLDYTRCYFVGNRRPDILFLAIHGGMLEPATYEIAYAMADAMGASFYGFYAHARTNAGDMVSRTNDDLHLTSRGFNDKECLKLVRQCSHIISLHGCKNPRSEESHEPDHDRVYKANIFFGGRDKPLRYMIAGKLAVWGWLVARHPNKKLRGYDLGNICNRGPARKGVHLEITKQLRDWFLTDEEEWRNRLDQFEADVKEWHRAGGLGEPPAQPILPVDETGNIRSRKFWAFVNNVTRNLEDIFPE